MGQTYKDAGVDIVAGEAAVSKISELARSTFSPNVLSGVGNFGAQYLFPQDRFDQPVLVSSTDGIGTKSIVAADAGKFDSIGEDLVNHCVNDILTTGAEPLFFLDYIGVGKLRAEEIHGIVKGLASACKKCDCSLIGGEMAEMPEIYGERHYDIVGTIVGVVERESLIDGADIEKGDILIGLRSNGLHTNGFTLARKALLNRMDLTSYHDDLGSSLGEELLKIHRCYLPSLKPILKECDIRGLAHITGGGIVGNTKRIVGDKLTVEIDWNEWEPDAVFSLIQQAGKVPEEEMRNTFNMGIGFVIACRETDVDKITKMLGNLNEEYALIGKIA